MKNRSGFASIIIILAIVLVVTIGGYFAWQKYSIPTIAQPIVSQPTNETANWKTYTDTQYGFELRYPPEGYLFDHSGGPDEFSIYSLDGSRRFSLWAQKNLFSLNDIVAKNLSAPAGWEWITVNGTRWLSGYNDNNTSTKYYYTHMKDSNFFYVMTPSPSDDQVISKIMESVRFSSPRQTPTVKSSVATPVKEQDCGSFGLTPNTPQQKSAMSCIANAFVNCTSATAIQLDSKNAEDSSISVQGKQNSLCVISQETLNPKTVQTCKFPLALMPTVQQVSKDSLASNPNETIENLSFTQIIAASFLSHKYQNPYNNDVTKIDCTFSVSSPQ